ncbi:MAG TPA: hypothetical protein PKW49_10705 [Paludibacteraceae bacterium]|nr:hypothetical protein [Paludibacteraceae bacterium]HQF50835.1 hypothetical protein [Paludibacteraceae bacterium]HQJ90106.1 hypothetical protein [Paludibacteraceae bacterium]
MRSHSECSYQGSEVLSGQTISNALVLRLNGKIVRDAVQHTIFDDLSRLDFNLEVC